MGRANPEEMNPEEIMSRRLIVCLSAAFLLSLSLAGSAAASSPAHPVTIRGASGALERQSWRHDHWYRWRAPSTGQLTVTVETLRGESFETPTVYLYSGPPSSLVLEELAVRDRPSDDTPALQAMVKEGVTYLIRTTEATEPFRMTWSLGTDPCTVEGTYGNDTLVGTSQSDYICAFGGDDRILASGGNDTIDGGSSYDMVSYQNAPGPIEGSISHNYDVGQVTGWGTDSLKLVEGLQGSSHADRLEGEAYGRYLGSYTTNTFIGGPGNDTLIGGWGTDQLYGWAGNDLLVPGFSTDPEQHRFAHQLVDGGAGTDTVSFACVEQCPDDSSDQEPSDLHVDLNQGTAAGSEDGEPYHEVAQIVNVENVIGTSLADVLRGSAGPNTIWGGDGDDTLFGYAGNDSLYGQHGNDSLDGGKGSDRCDQGVGTGTVVACEG